MQFVQRRLDMRNPVFHATNSTMFRFPLEGNVMPQIRLAVCLLMEQ
jgi:hypothetical protein